LLQNFNVCKLHLLSCKKLLQVSSHHISYLPKWVNLLGQADILQPSDYANGLRKVLRLIYTRNSQCLSVHSILLNCIIVYWWACCWEWVTAPPWPTFLKALKPKNPNEVAGISSQWRCISIELVRVNLHDFRSTIKFAIAWILSKHITVIMTPHRRLFFWVQTRSVLCK
jgi:hypothetical protein